MVIVFVVVVAAVVVGGGGGGITASWLESHPSYTCHDCFRVVGFGGLIVWGL